MFWALILKQLTQPIIHYIVSIAPSFLSPNLIFLIMTLTCTLKWILFDTFLAWIFFLTPSWMKFLISSITAIHLMFQVNILVSWSRTQNLVPHPGPLGHLFFGPSVFGKWEVEVFFWVISMFPKAMISVGGRWELVDFVLCLVECHSDNFLLKSVHHLLN